jgi:hypothetical protein
MNPQPNYGQVERFLNAYSTVPGPYDFNGLLHLILTGVDNLRAHAVDQDVKDFACAISDEQAAFLPRLLDGRVQSNAQLEGDQ